MERQLERCGGPDVHKETVAACVRVGGRTRKAGQHVQTFGTTVGELAGTAGLAGRARRDDRTRVAPIGCTTPWRKRA
jgi:hypothetical protein